MNQKIKVALSHEAHLYRLTNDVRDEIVRRIRHGATSSRIKRNGRYIAVSLSVVRENGLNLSTQYYLPETQAEAVDAKLRSAHTMSSVLDRLNEMVTTKTARLSQDNNVPLNARTISILREFM